MLCLNYIVRRVVYEFNTMPHIHNETHSLSAVRTTRNCIVGDKDVNAN